MAQQPALMKVKAKKMFKASISGALPVMVNPGDVVEVDRFMAGMLVNSEKAELTDEKPRINPDYKAPERLPSVSDPIGLLTRAVEHLTKIVQELTSDKQKKLQH
jgi:hypothetical protein